jgi:lipopolysaccharide export system permease protein
MKIIHRYYLKEFLKLFSIIACGLGLTFSLMELINKISDFIPNRPSMGDLLLYSGLNMPQYVLYLMPMAALISGLFVFGQAARRKETIAIKASGGSIKALLMPFVYSGVFLSVAGFLLSEFVVPDFSRKVHLLRDTLSKKENILTFKEGTVWLRAKDAIVKIDLFLPDKGVVQGVSIMKMDGPMLAERIEAESAQWNPVWESPGNPNRGIWHLRGVTEYKIKDGTVASFKEVQSDIIDSPDIFKEDMLQPEEMNVRELTAYTKRLKKAGFRNTKLTVDIQSRISYPLINLIMLVLGIALASKGHMGGGLITAAIGIFISLLYWVGYTGTLSMGYAGILSPFIAAWVMPLFFGGIAIYLFRTVPE